jgi:hypothetical protein
VNANVCPATSLILGSLSTPDTMHNGCKKEENILFRGEMSKRTIKKEFENKLLLNLKRSPTPFHQNNTI